jgi:hypothetical protein
MIQPETVTASGAVSVGSNPTGGALHAWLAARAAGLGRLSSSRCHPTGKKMTLFMRRRPGTSPVMLTAAVISVAVAGGLLLGSGTAAAAPPAVSAGWSIQAMSSPSGSVYTFLGGVSCTSASACTAVGYYDTDTGTATLAARWNGSTWTIQATPNPAGPDSALLTGVSCTSASACTAVGYSGTSTGTTATLAEHWNGSTWTIQATPNPPGAARTLLTGVSCASASACTAVGYSGTSTQTATLAERWNGTTWTIQATPNQTGQGGDNLQGVSCASGNACIAVGYSGTPGTSSNSATLSEVWNGTAWTVQATPHPGNASFLFGVSCTSASACTAVGVKTSAGLAERWNGTAWKTQRVPGQATFLAGVSCTSATACTAAGYSVGKSGKYRTLAEAWNGTAWTHQTTPDQASYPGSFLLAASCTSASTCMAVGYYGGTNGPPAFPLAEQEQG